LSKKKRKNIIIGIIAVTLIILVIGYSYSAEQTRLKGFNFGNYLQAIQEDLKKIETDFQSEIAIFQEGDSSTEEFLEYSNLHISKMEELILRYDDLEPPTAFVTSVAFFKLSSQSQLEADNEIIQWIKNTDETAKIRSDSLMQEAFEYELAALAKFNAAKAGLEP
jgi:type II secretory pathway pseudopilin PulG